MRKILMIVSICIIALHAKAQVNTGNIEGQILTPEGTAVPNVNVRVKGTKKNAVTDETGVFIFTKVPYGNYILVYSFEGQESKEIPVTVPPTTTEATKYNLTLNSRQLNEVVVRIGGSINRGTATVGKAGIPIMDMPQAVTIIGKNTIENQQAQRLSDVVKNVNGVYLGSVRGATQETFWARGYNISTNNMFKNGFRLNNGAMPEMSGLESVEFLKGNAALLYGNVAPGGIINMVTKKPKFNFGGEASMRVGSFDLYKPAIDIYGPVSNTVAYRLNGTYEQTNSFRDNVHSKRYYVNPSLLFRLGNRTDLLVQGDYLNHEFTPDFGIGTTGNTTTKVGNVTDAPRSRFMGTPWQYAKTKQATASAYLNHELNDNWKLNFGLSYQDYTRDYFSTERVQAAPNGDWGRPLGKTNTKENYYTAQANLTGKFNTGSLKHSLLAGIDADKYHTIIYTAKFPGTANSIYDSINVLDPQKFTPRTDIPNWEWNTKVQTPTERLGAYFQDLIAIGEKVKVLVGARWSWLQASPVQTDTLTNGKQKLSATLTDQAFSPKLGIVYQPAQNTALFASYSNSFTPNTGVDIFNAPLAPSIIDQLEAGIKQDWLDGKLSTNLTLYQIVNSNFAQMADSVNGQANTNTNIKTLSGQTKSKGLELDIKGRPAKGLDIIAGYSYNDMRFTKTINASGNTIAGQRVVNTPRHTGNLTALYTVTEGALKGLKFGAGYYYTGERLGGWNTPAGGIKDRTFSVKGFSTIDATLGYTYKKLSLLTKVANITNTYNYYVHENYSVNPIPPRNFVATLAYRF